MSFSPHVHGSDSPATTCTRFTIAMVISIAKTSILTRVARNSARRLTSTAREQFSIITAARRRPRAAGSPHLLRGKGELESRDPEIARRCGRGLRHRFRRRTFSRARGGRRPGQVHVRRCRQIVTKSSTHSSSAFIASTSRANPNWRHRPHRRRKKYARADRVARKSRCRSAHASIHLDRLPREQVRHRAGPVPAVYERAAKMRNIEIVGVQMHIGSQITEAEAVRRNRKSRAARARLKSKYAIKFFSIGGGMGIIYRRALKSGSGKWWHDHGPAANDPRSASAIMLMQLCRRCATWVFGSLSSPAVFLSATPAFCSRAFVTSSRLARKNSPLSMLA